MPQMFPLNWLMLYFFFILSFFIMGINLYYNNNFKPLKKNICLTNKSFKNFNWKW
uniref:ATP synthase complex subunit 8 n=1 Tax=Sinopoppia nigroflagella TaxID=2803872 RepID=A0A897FZW8_9HYME|nr:ATP synthase F0 subunit 8 [Sinopoppia nigroflagella]QSF20067.1 ATP synthase F0 subunit 8 [Sinopoppia nigroflagella]